MIVSATKTEVRIESQCEAAFSQLGEILTGPVNIRVDGMTYVIAKGAGDSDKPVPEDVAALAAMLDPDLDTLRAELGLKREKGESRQKLCERMAAKQRELSK